MLAVLPFSNLTGDATQEYFSDGLTEEMIAHLGRLDPQHLRVIARTSVMTYKNDQKPVDVIARELGVEYVLEGSVRREPGKVRITAQLIQARDQTHIWSQEYDRELSSLLAIQGDIARQIAEEIQLAFDRQAHSASPNVVLTPGRYEAYDLYLKGQYFLNKRTIPAFQQAIKAFQESTEISRRRSRLCRAGQLLHAAQCLQPVARKRLRFQGPCRGDTRAATRRQPARSADRASSSRPELRLELAGSGKGIPARD